MKIFVILGNHLFNPIYLKDYSDHKFVMYEDYGLCTYEKHHKLKILLFLSSMRSYYDELKLKKFKVDYFSVKNNFILSLKNSSNHLFASFLVVGNQKFLVSPG